MPSWEKVSRGTMNRAGEGGRIWERERKTSVRREEGRGSSNEVLRSEKGGEDHGGLIRRLPVFQIIT